ncbi:hypothetical protein EfmAA242_19140 [Enterococcus faecium]|nr:hypothetical protein EfmAA242_19140 [Enterococcus faecium]
MHKLKFTSAPENQINNGTELTFPNSEPLNGVEFNVYDITATYYPSKDTAVPADGEDKNLFTGGRKWRNY